MTAVMHPTAEELWEREQESVLRDLRRRAERIVQDRERAKDREATERGLPAAAHADHDALVSAEFERLVRTLPTEPSKTYRRWVEEVRIADPELLQRVMCGETKSVKRAKRILRDRKAAADREERDQREADFIGIPVSELAEYKQRELEDLRHANQRWWITLGLAGRERVLIREALLHDTSGRVRTHLMRGERLGYLPLSKTTTP